MIASDGDHADPRVGEEGGGDDDAVAEVVDAVAEDHAPAAAAGLLAIEAVMVVVLVAFVVVAVAVELGLLEQEEEQQAAEQRREQRLRRRLGRERLGQDVEQRGREQDARREAHQVVHDLRQHRQRQCRGDEHREHAADAGGDDDPGERHARSIAAAKPEPTARGAALGGTASRSERGMAKVVAAGAGRAF